MGDLRRTVLPLMLLGNTEAKKTSIIQKFCCGEVYDSNREPIVKESYIYLVRLHGYDLKIKIWDTSGQESFKYLSVELVKVSEAVILVYSVNNLNSFISLDDWLNKLDEIRDISNLPIIIIGHKYDNEKERVITTEEGKRYAEKKGYHFYEVSAKTGEGINEAFDDIIEQLFFLFEDEITGKKTKTKVNKNKKLNYNNLIQLKKYISY